MSDRGFRALVENALDAIVVSRDGIVLYANGSAARLLGHDSSEELVGKPMSFLDARSLGVMRRRLQQMAETGEKLVPREYPAKRRDGSEIIAEIASTFIEFDGAPAVLAYARDVTEQARLRAQLAHADRLTALGMLAAGVAHEINNPLTFVGLAAEMLGRRVPETEASLVADVKSGIERIAAIVRDLRFFGRYEDEAPGPMDVGAALVAAERLVAHEIRPRARLVKDLGELPAVVGVGRRVEQVFVNLLLNAALAMEEKPAGSIVVSAHATADRVVVSIRDEGVGIAPDKLESVFEPFFTTRARGGGTGLGLSICRDIIVRAGGDLVARSTLGEGTTMEVSFVRATREVVAPKTIPAPPPDLETKSMRRVLVVDDEPLIVSALVAGLACTANVVGETSSKRALARLMNDETFDVIVCDVMMPELSGIDMHERLGREKPGLESRFVFITGGTYTTRARDYLARVPNLRLTKPFSIEELAAAIEAIESASVSR